MSGPRYRHVQPPVPELELLVIDGDNLLHRVRGMRDAAGVHWLLPRLRAWRPLDVQVLLMLDGASGPGVGARQQVVPGITMQHSGRLDADTAIVDLVRARGYAERARTVVVTDDHQLSDRVRHVGVLVRRLDWLVDQLAGPQPVRSPGPGLSGASPAKPRSSIPTGTPQGTPAQASGPPMGIGAGRPPRAPDATTPIERDPEDAREPWKPGRGATTKRGNPKRARTD